MILEGGIEAPPALLLIILPAIKLNLARAENREWIDKGWDRKRIVNG